MTCKFSFMSVHGKENKHSSQKMFILMFSFSMSEHGVIGVLCSDQQGLALSGQYIKLNILIDLHLTFTDIRRNR